MAYGPAWIYLMGYWGGQPFVQSLDHHASFVDAGQGGPDSGGRFRRGASAASAASAAAAWAVEASVAAWVAAASVAVAVAAAVAAAGGGGSGGGGGFEAPTGRCP